MGQCTATKTVEDEICVMDFRCELVAGHDGAHQTTYPGLDEGDLSSPVFWTDNDSGRANFHRSRQVSSDYYK